MADDVINLEFPVEFLVFHRGIADVDGWSDPVDVRFFALATFDNAKIGRI